MNSAAAPKASRTYARTRVAFPAFARMRARSVNAVYVSLETRGDVKLNDRTQNHNERRETGGDERDE